MYKNSALLRLHSNLIVRSFFTLYVIIHGNNCFPMGPLPLQCKKTQHLQHQKVIFWIEMYWFTVFVISWISCSCNWFYTCFFFYFISTSLLIAIKSLKIQILPYFVLDMNLFTEESIAALLLLFQMCQKCKEFRWTLLIGSDKIKEFHALVQELKHPQWFYTCFYINLQKYYELLS